MTAELRLRLWDLRPADCGPLASALMHAPGRTALVRWPALLCVVEPALLTGLAERALWEAPGAAEAGDGGHRPAEFVAGCRAAAVAVRMAARLQAPATLAAFEARGGMACSDGLAPYMEAMCVLPPSYIKARARCGGDPTGPSASRAHAAGARPRPSPPQAPPPPPSPPALDALAPPRAAQNLVEEHVALPLEALKLLWWVGGMMVGGPWLARFGPFDLMGRPNLKGGLMGGLKGG
jgi:hypothetical protein